VTGAKEATMNLTQQLQTTFVLLEADWPADQSRKLVRDFPERAATHVIVHQGDPGAGAETYYLFTRKQALDLLSLGGTVGAALDLPNTDAAASLDVSVSRGDAPARAVVFAGGSVAGYIDEEFETLGGPTRGGALAANGGEGAATVQRSLVADMPESVALNDIATLLVSLAAEAPPDLESLALTLEVGSTLDVVVQPSSGLKVEGRREGSFAVTNDGESPPLMFKLRGTAIGPTQIRVLAFRDGQSLGQLELPVMVQEAVASADSARATAELVPAGGRRPDLSLHIFSEVEDGQTVLTFRLSAANNAENLYLTELGTKTLVSDPGRYFAEFFSDIENLMLDSPEKQKEAELQVQIKGAQLFSEVFPEQVKEKLWQLRDRIASIQIESMEPFIPWELCRLSGKDGDSVVDGPFLCEKFNITRWPLGMGMRPNLKLDNIAMVVPADSGLPFAQEERQYLLGLAGGQRAVKEIPATYASVLMELASGQYDGWHFSGHGATRSQDANRSAIFLTDNTPFTPEALNGPVTNLGKAKPLVFLNACQAGRGGFSLTDVGGWGEKFLRAGAAAFIGTYWTVSDRPALEFARGLYGRLLAGMPIGQAAKEARAEIKAGGNPTWLAYTVFADPWAAVSTAPADTPPST
jgi:hypothetical protein